MVTEEPVTDERRNIQRVLLTGATGFVGRYVLRELLVRGYTPVCLVRSRTKLAQVAEGFDQSRIAGVTGSLFEREALNLAAEQSDAAIHLVGIIMQNRLMRQTFDRVHRRGTQAVVDALKAAGIRRFVHMSALGARPDAVSAYHRTKYAAEQVVRQSGLDWTIFEPSVIHGCDGDFMQLLKRFCCRLIPPVMPYFGSGDARVQPVSVKDVAYCFVNALVRDETIGQIYPIGGPVTYSWKELYTLCRRIIPGAKQWKPLASLPVPLAKLLARTVMKTPLVPGGLKFNVDQVWMSQEDSTCSLAPIESTFGIKLRDFEDELTRYAELIE